LAAYKVDGVRDPWQLLRHRDKLVPLRTAVWNQLHALAMGEGLSRKKKLRTERGRRELESLTLGEWASRRREESQKLSAKVKQTRPAGSARMCLLTGLMPL
jgi:hypothetical protein